ncbi:MAG: DUF4810 domain-containing protein [Verrucomicrobiota bacterium]
MKHKIYIVIGLAVAAIFSGCNQTTAYYWGEYEEQVYRMYAAPDQATAVAQLEVLELDLQKAAATDKPLAPGFRAHMGFLYYQLGRFDEARNAFETEKAEFPESGKMMDRFIQKLGRSNA